MVKTVCLEDRSTNPSREAPKLSLGVETSFHRESLEPTRSQLMMKQQSATTSFSPPNHSRWFGHFRPSQNQFDLEIWSDNAKCGSRDLVKSHFLRDKWNYRSPRQCKWKLIGELTS